MGKSGEGRRYDLSASTFADICSQYCRSFSEILATKLLCRGERPAKINKHNKKHH